MSLALEQKTNADGYAKPGELIEITGTALLEASDRAILNLLYQHAHDSGRLGDADAAFEIPITDLLHSKHSSTDRIRESLSRLLAVQVRMNIKHPRTGKPSVLQTTLFHSFITPESPEPGEPVPVRFSIPAGLLPVLLNSNRWGRIKAEIVCAMSSKYAIALYELVQLRAGLDRCVEVFPVERFRELLGVPHGAYTEGAGFVGKVLEPAALQVNALSDMGVTIETRRRSPRAPIESICLAWWRKEGEPYREAMRERERSKLGRKARLQGKVEELAVVQTRLTARA